MEKDTYKYDENGHRTEANEYKPDGSLVKKFTYTYDDVDNGYSTETNVFKEDGSIYMKFTIINDNNGNETEMKDYFDDGSLYQKITYKYKYDKMGNWIEKRVYINGKLDEIFVRLIDYYS